MTIRAQFLLIRFAVLSAVALYGQAMAPVATASEHELPLRFSAPLDAVVTDLESFIPGYMRDQNTPGVAIALIHDGAIAWTGGFGVANAITGEPVTPEMLFEIASNSKVVTAYIALRLVDQGMLSLDEPLDAYLSEPWLPDPEYRDEVTLRRVLSHTSGLGASIAVSRDLLFEPGRHYYYSGIGFMYLQEVIEQVTGKPLEVVAREMVFTPLNMSSSSFVNETTLASRAANGHLWAIIPAVLFTIPYVMSLVLVGILGLVLLRILSGRWRPTQWMVIGACSLAFVLSLVPMWVLFRPLGLLEFVWVTGLLGIALIVVFGIAFSIGRAVIRRLFPGRPAVQIGLAVVSTILILAGLATLVTSMRNVPVPRWTPVVANGAGSMRATASDMATFLVELAKPLFLDPSAAMQLQASQVRLSQDLSWGAGVGVQHSHQGNALWQWGQHFDFQSVMIIYPEHGFGVVVLTNSDLLNPDVALNIAHRALGGDVEPMRRAIHLEFNYREGAS
jgi:CubicO group peptidase (beta-lactamase class C family)